MVIMVKTRDIAKQIYNELKERKTDKSNFNWWLKWWMKLDVKRNIEWQFL